MLRAELADPREALEASIAWNKLLLVHLNVLLLGYLLPPREARDLRLGLAALAQEDDVLPREDGVFDLGQDGVFVADDAGEKLRAGLETHDEVVAELLLDRF